VLREVLDHESCSESDTTEARVTEPVQRSRGPWAGRALVGA
jgi:hypothetical protein